VEAEAGGKQNPPAQTYRRGTSLVGAEAVAAAADMAASQEVVFHRDKSALQALSAS
jgi:hypothetical protein